MVRQFEYEGNTYSYILYEELDDNELPYNAPTRKKEKRHFLDYGCGYDIEVTKIPKEAIIECSEDKEFSAEYVWQFSINETTIIGRTWEEFEEFRKRLSARLHLSEKRRLLVFIHNEKFEWSFMKDQIKWADKTIKKFGKIIDVRPDVFSLDDRTVIKAVSEEWFEFRCSYVLTQRSLAKLAKDFNLGIKKLDDVNFNYDLLRHIKTKLTKKELAYCINDVQILQLFYHKYIKPEFIEKGLKVPLTATGIPREELKRAFKELPKEEKEAYKNMIKNAFPKTKEEYNFMLAFLYRGGYTHANIEAVNETYSYFDDLSSWDFKSSYPAVLLHNLFPYEFKEVDPDEFYGIMLSNYHKFFKENAIWGVFTIHNIKNLTSHSIESESKIISHKNAVFDNGRLVRADEIRVALTEVDILNYLDFYDVGDINQWECEHLQVSEKKPLPKFFRNMILKYYFLKEEAGKNKHSDPVYYSIRKSLLNSLYGMLVTAITQEDTRFYAEEGIIGKGNATASYREGVNNSLLLPQHGIWTTAYARRNLLKTVKKLGDDNLYSDTDSNKIRNTTGNKHIFDEYNERIERMNMTMDVGDYDRELFRNCGKYDFEGRLLKLKTLGCKRYLHTDLIYNKDNNKYEQKTTATVSGLIKGSLQEFCELNKLDIYETFNSDLDPDERVVFSLDKNVSKKNTTVYFDKPFTAELTDYQGNTTIVSEKSGCTIVSIPFEMRMSEDFLNLLIFVNDRKKKKGRVI